MKRVQAMVQLNDELVANLDREAAQRGCSRSVIVREAISEHLAASTERARVREYVDGYRRVPQGASDEWGDVQADLGRRRLATARRLDAEEEAAGQRW